MGVCGIRRRTTGRGKGKRLVSLGLGAFYGFVSAGIVAFIRGTGSQSSGTPSPKTSPQR